MACARVGRDPASVTLVAVSKTVDVERLRAAVAAGLTTLGENRVQEAAAKAGLVPGATWHLVGHLQGNKVRLALGPLRRPSSRSIRSRWRRASIGWWPRVRRLGGDVAGVGRGAGTGRRHGRQAVFLQVNVDADPAKAGFQPDELPAALPTVLALPNLEVRGLMTVGRLAAIAGGRPADLRRPARAVGERCGRPCPGWGRSCRWA